MKKNLVVLTFILSLFMAPLAGAINIDPQNSCTINTTNALTAHATDCTSVTAVADVVCYERDADLFYVCEPSAGDCDTAGEWKVLSYLPLTGGTLTGALTLDDVGLAIEEGVDTLTITAPALTASRAVTFSDAAGEVTINDATQTLTNKTLTAANNVIGADTAVALAADPADCSANQYANAIDASGALTCAGVTEAQVSISAQDLDIADTGDGLAATATLNPSSSVVIITCSDADGCDITMGETDTSVRTVSITNDSANAANFADSAGVSELAGVFAMGTNDSLQLIYTGATWVETSRSDN